VALTLEPAALAGDVESVWSAPSPWHDPLAVRYLLDLWKEALMNAIALVLVAAAIGAGPGKIISTDVVFTYDKLEYTLREDGTWLCKGAGCPKPGHDPYTVDVNFGDNKTIVFEGDGYWHYKEPGELIGYGDITIKSVHVEGVGNNQRIDLAEQVAVKSVWEKVAPKVLAGTPKRKLTKEKVLWCLKDMRVAPDITRKQQPKGGWTVTAGITLDYAQILTIVRCGAQLVEAKEAEAQSPAAPAAEQAGSTE
jgi:hypothetical protein